MREDTQKEEDVGWEDTRAGQGGSREVQGGLCAAPRGYSGPRPARWESSETHSFGEVTPTGCFLCLELLRGLGELAESWGRVCGMQETKQTPGNRESCSGKEIKRAWRRTGGGQARKVPARPGGRRRERTHTVFPYGEKPTDNAELED